MSRLLAGYRQTHPGTRWSLVTSLRGAMIDGLRDGQFDLAICEAQNEDDITNTPLMREPLHLALPSGHPRADKAPMRPADLAGIPYIGLHRSMGTSAEAQRFFAAGEAHPAPVVEVNDTHLVPHLVSTLTGFGITPASVTPAGAPVVTVDTEPGLTRQISLAHLTTRTLPPATDSFVAFLTERWQAARDGRSGTS
ncbi:LysR substrate-binding domain-containing protein [Amycolatopsis acidicola]|uniref:LysR substrate-binding domain-containing protein n=1 Tax=Amycolatopsis acidicola TaxID=2596893 RepID=UPI0014078CCE|nr:LysR substrate-binding domain-containing protein [Amycolatopsis acidicola]